MTLCCSPFLSNENGNEVSSFGVYYLFYLIVAY